MRTRSTAVALCLFLLACRGEPRAPRSSSRPDASRAASATPLDAGAAAADPSPAPVQDERCPDGMVFIPGGTFIMGDDDNRLQKRHQVTLSPYCIDRTEVTQAAYKACAAQKACNRPAQDSIGCNFDNAEYDQYPINCITWFEADTYCKWARKRLPTEAEWEFAARGTDGRMYPWGDTDDRTKQVRAGLRPKPVGSKPEGASPFGVFDLSGNVTEWVADWDAPYGLEPLVDPKGPPEGENKIARGSNFGGGGDTPSTWRGGTTAEAHMGALGTRCAADFSEVAPAPRAR